MKFKQVLETVLFSVDNYNLTVYRLALVLIILLVTRISLLVVRLVLRKAASKAGPNDNRHYGIYQLIKYFGWTLGIVISINALGINVSVIVAGSAALFVGIGFGLQDTFQDFVSGIIILVEHNIKPGDVVEMDGMVAKVSEIGLRTSRVITRDEITMIIPNSKLVSGYIINWSHSKSETRFSLDVGVAYNADPDKVRQTLLECACTHPGIIRSGERMPFVRLTSFGDSSVGFALFFYSEEAFKVEQIKSELRFAIFSAFRQNGIEIPFPQQDVYIKSMPKQ